MRKTLRAVFSLALFLGITVTGSTAVNVDLGRVKNCEDFVGDVVCKLRGGSNGGGRYYCYYSLCEAEAAGAFSCKPAIPVCEPH